MDSDTLRRKQYKSHKTKKVIILVLISIVMIGTGFFVSVFAKDSEHGNFVSIKLSDGSIIKPWYSENEEKYYYFLPSYARHLLLQMLEELVLKEENTMMKIA